MAQERVVMAVARGAMDCKHIGTSSINTGVTLFQMHACTCGSVKPCHNLDVIDQWHVDDGSGRQQFHLSKHPVGVGFSIQASQKKSMHRQINSKYKIILKRSDFTLQSVYRGAYVGLCPSFVTASPTCSNTSLALTYTASTVWNISCNSGGNCTAAALVSELDSRCACCCFMKKTILAFIASPSPDPHNNQHVMCRHGRLAPMVTSFSDIPPTVRRQLQPCVLRVP